MPPQTGSAKSSLTHDLGAVATTDPELLDPRSDQAVLDDQGGAPLIALRVDHEDPAGVRAR